MPFSRSLGLAEWSVVFFSSWAMGWLNPSSFSREKKKEMKKNRRNYDCQYLRSLTIYNVHWIGIKSKPCRALTHIFSVFFFSFGRHKHFGPLVKSNSTSHRIWFKYSKVIHWKLPFLRRSMSNYQIDSKNLFFSFSKFPSEYQTQ